MEPDLTLPEILAELHRIPLDYDDGYGVDFEPYEQFLPAEETASWFRAWTGNPEVTGAEFRVFGQDGTGGLAAFWLVRPGADLPGQPVAFLGSEGATGVAARDLADYLWLFAAGYGPMEAVENPPVDDEPRYDLPEVRALAERFAPAARKNPLEVLAAARADSERLVAWVDTLIR